MVDINQIQEHATVVGADGGHIGTVDHVRDGRIKLTKNDSTDGKHHYLAANQIAGVENGTVRLAVNADAAQLEAAE